MIRIRLDQPELAITTVLADLAAHGPSTFAELRVRQLSVMDDRLIRRAVETLEADGQVTVDVKALATTRLVGGKPRTFVYRAKVYELVKARGKGGKRTDGKRAGGNRTGGKRSASTNPSPAPPVTPPLTPPDKSAQRAAHQALVLDDLATHGACLCRDVSARLAGVVNESDVHRALVDLAKAGRLTAVMRNVPPPTEVGARGWRSRYRANVYSLAGGDAG